MIFKVERTEYRHWSTAYRCTAGAAELIVIADVGPRILSLRWQDGANLLYEDQTGLGIGAWRLYGGHRFTVAPEGRASYAPDNAPCLAEMRPHELRVAAEPGTNGTQRMLVISAARDGVGFDLCHVLQNHASHSWRGALWAITCVPPSKILAPGTRSGLRFWPGTDKDDWDLAPDYIASASSGRRGKIGWHSETAWLASQQQAATLVIHSPNPPPANKCVDEGCNMEIFRCANYMELETLGGEIILAPGGHATHLQRWRLLEPDFAPSDGATLAALAGCASTPPLV